MIVRAVYIIPTKYLYSLADQKTPGVRLQIKEATRNGEMALVPTIQIWLNDQLDMEIDRSHCIVYYLNSV